MQQELDVLTALVDAQQASEREERKHHNDDIRKRKVVTFIQSCWRRLLAKKNFKGFKKRLKLCLLSPLMIQ
jgi:hypothetical protein